MTSFPTENYGAVPQKPQKSLVEEDRDFDIENSRYLVSTGAERRRNCMYAFLPVSIFSALMLFITYLLSNDFGTLYPGHGGGSNSQPILDVKYPTSQTADSNSGVSLDDDRVPTSYPTALIEESHYKPLSLESCEANHKCFELNLTGKCCPSPEGVFLLCCSN